MTSLAAEEEDRSPGAGAARVLSIQSHVVSGYCGNKSAVFPLQVLGFDVDPINSVHFSNHTGYPSFKGQRLNGEELWDVFTGLDVNGLTSGYTHLLTGYIGTVSFLRRVADVLKRLRTLNPQLTYVCDPVMGDHDALYVSPELVPIYRDEIIQHASVLTPNQFEAEYDAQVVSLFHLHLLQLFRTFVGRLLSGIKITNIETAKACLNALHDKGIPIVIITSSNIVVEGHSADSVSVIGSSMAADGVRRYFHIAVPRLNLPFTGSGDLFAALLLAWSHAFPHDVLSAVEHATNTMSAVLKRTLAYYELHALPPDDRDGKDTSRLKELRLVQSKRDIEQPQLLYRAQLL